MNCYTINGTLAEGIALGKSGLIEVGEQGRGRKLVAVPPPAGAVVVEGRLVSAPVSTPGGVVLLVKDHSGYRGGWTARDARTPAEWDAYVVGEKKAEAFAREWQKADHPEGEAFPGVEHLKSPLPKRPPVWRVLTEGRCAQGTAGAMGGGPEYLVVMAPGQAVDISRSGRLYGKPEVLQLRVDSEGKVTLVDPRAEAESRLAASW